MSFERKRLGQSGENLACQYLIKKGYELLGRNLRLFCGEIDILMKQGNTIIVVEVKTKTSSRFSLPQEKVDNHKKQKLVLLASAVAQQFPQHPIRIDVVGVDEETSSVDHIINAVEDS